MNNTIDTEIVRAKSTCLRLIYQNISIGKFFDDE